MATSLGMSLCMCMLLVSLQSHDSLCFLGNVIGLSITTPLLSSEKRDCRATEVRL